MLNRHTNFNSKELNNIFISKVNYLFSFIKNEFLFEKISWIHFLIIINAILLSTSIGRIGNNPNFNNWSLGALIIDDDSDSSSKKESIKYKASVEHWLTEKNANAENLPSLIRQKSQSKKDNIESLILPPAGGMSFLRKIFSLRNVLRFLKKRNESLKYSCLDIPPPKS